MKLTDDFLVPIIIKAHHLGHHQLITCCFDMIEDLMPPCCHPVPFNPLDLHHGFLLVEIDRMVPIRMEERPKVGVMGLFAALIHRCFSIVIDCALLCLLGVAEGYVGGPLNWRMTL
jgi:hypothetical protein